MRNLHSTSRVAISTEMWCCQRVTSSFGAKSIIKREFLKTLIIERLQKIRCDMEQRKVEKTKANLKKKIMIMKRVEKAKVKTENRRLEEACIKIQKVFRGSRERRAQPLEEKREEILKTQYGVSPALDGAGGVMPSWKVTTLDQTNNTARLKNPALTQSGECDIDFATHIGGGSSP